MQIGPGAPGPVCSKEQGLDDDDQDMAIKVIDALIMQTRAERLMKERLQKKKRARG